MKLRNPFFVENLYQDQPYASLLLVAPYCDFKCKGCQNLCLKEAEIKDFTPKELANYFNSNPFVEGITVAGLEITLCDKKWLNELIEFIKISKVKSVTIYTRENINHKKIKFLLKEIKDIDSLENIMIKTGKHDPTLQQKEIIINNITIKLSSSNQEFHIIKKNKNLYISDNTKNELLTVSKVIIFILLILCTLYKIIIT